MGDIIGKVLLMALFVFVIGLILHLTKYLFSPSYRKEISDKKLLRKQLTDFLKALENSNDEAFIMKNLFLKNPSLNCNLHNYKQIEQDIKNEKSNKFPLETDIYTCIDAGIYSGCDYELSKCLENLNKKNISGLLNTELKIGIEILKKQSEINEKYKNNDNFKLISTYNTHRLKYNNLLKKMRNELKSIKENFIVENLGFTLPDFENILNKLNNESDYEILLKDLIEKNSTLEEIINLSILINIYEKISIDLTENINKLIK
jgi:hypothetical protein